uniref:Rho-GAP domain-containing protein n=1 Tax=Arcella intermedia TaxID=1963864 RepID=A0A6B2KZ56_9EUKA
MVPKKKVKNRGKIFGVELNQLVREEGREIPSLVVSSVEYLKDCALSEEGIFRIAPENNELNLIKNIVDRLTEKITFSDFDFKNPHIVCALLKAFLRELPVPLLNPWETFASILEDSNDTLQFQLEKCISAIQKMDMPYQSCLDYVVSFLCCVVEQSDKNKMDTLNISSLIGPNIMWKVENSPLLALQNAKTSNNVTAFLISNYKEIFANLNTSKSFCRPSSTQSITASITITVPPENNSNSPPRRRLLKKVSKSIQPYKPSEPNKLDEHMDINLIRSKSLRKKHLSDRPRSRTKSHHTNTIDPTVYDKIFGDRKISVIYDLLTGPLTGVGTKTLKTTAKTYHYVVTGAAIVKWLEVNFKFTNGCELCQILLDARLIRSVENTPSFSVEGHYKFYKAKDGLEFLVKESGGSSARKKRRPRSVNLSGGDQPHFGPLLEPDDIAESHSHSEDDTVHIVPSTESDSSSTVTPRILQPPHYTNKKLKNHFRRSSSPVTSERITSTVSDSIPIPGQSGDGIQITVKTILSTSLPSMPHSQSDPMANPAFHGKSLKSPPVNNASSLYTPTKQLLSDCSDDTPPLFFASAPALAGTSSHPHPIPKSLIKKQPSSTPNLIEVLHPKSLVIQIQNSDGLALKSKSMDVETENGLSPRKTKSSGPLSPRKSSSRLRKSRDQKVTSDKADPPKTSPLTAQTPNTNTIQSVSASQQ